MPIYSIESNQMFTPLSTAMERATVCYEREVTQTLLGRYQFVCHGYTAQCKYQVVHFVRVSPSSYWYASGHEVTRCDTHASPPPWHTPLHLNTIASSPFRDRC